MFCHESKHNIITLCNQSELHYIMLKKGLSIKYSRIWNQNDQSQVAKAVDTGRLENNPGYTGTC